MGNILDWINNIWTRTFSGQNEYFIDNHGRWSKKASNLYISQRHPILTPAILFISQLFSTAEFKVIDKKTKKEINNHWSLNLLENPNSYQSNIDFLESIIFNQVAEGKCVVWAKKLPGFEEPTELHILENSRIQWPISAKQNPFYNFETTKESIEYKINDNGSFVEKNIKISELIIFYDLPNGMINNRIEVKSRLDGLKQTLLNTYDSLIAKNIILKSNGKEMVTGTKNSHPMTPEEKDLAEKHFSNKYGLATHRLRALILRGEIKWKSLHIALRDLGLDESVKVDGNLIYTALHIPKDILSLEAKKTTYNNFKESMVSYIQNDIQSKMNNVCAKLTMKFGLNESDLKVIANYDHLPVMQSIKLEKYKSISAQAKAYQDLIDAGFSREYSLSACDFEENL